MARGGSIVAALLISLLSAGALAAATLCVNPGGTGGCSATVQAAIDAAVDGDTIGIAAGTYVENPSVPENRVLTLQGAGAGSTFIDGSDLGGVLLVRHRAAVTISGVTLQNGPSGIAANGGEFVTIDITDSTITGNAGSPRFGYGILLPAGRLSVARCTIGDFNPGGAILNQRGRATITDTTLGDTTGGGCGLFADGGVTTVVDSTIRGNAGLGTGGGICARGSAKVLLISSTVSGNSDAGAGGGIRVSERAFVKVASSTIASNSAGMSGGGIRNDGPRSRIRVHNTILADNTAGDGSDDCSGVLRSRRYNLIESTSGCTVAVRDEDIVGVDPMLASLAANGGPTETHALLAGSAAIDAANPAPADGRVSHCPPTDQRGTARNGRCDIGAYEF